MVSGKLNSHNKPPIYTPPLPCPQRFRKAKLDAQFGKFLNIYKKLEVIIPFADALVQMPNYAVGIVSLYENYSAIIQRKLLEKLRDPSSFTIP